MQYSHAGLYGVSSCVAKWGQRDLKWVGAFGLSGYFQGPCAPDIGSGLRSKRSPGFRSWCRRGAGPGLWT